jgi:hypothetical protein
VNKGSWNAQRGCFENVVPEECKHLPSVQGQSAPMSVGTLDIALNEETVTMPQPSPVDNQTTHSSSLDFCHSIDALRSLMNVMSAQLSALWTPAQGQEAQCLAVLKSLENELAQMSLSLASLIYCTSSNGEARTGSPKPRSPNASPTGSTHGD